MTVISEEPRRNGMRYFKCKCICGNIKITQGVCLNNGRCKSCGCLQKEYAVSGAAKRTHGFSKTRFYRIFKGMKNRCYNENEPAYPRYGGRDIKVYLRWHKFENFKQDMYDSYMLHVAKFGEKNTSIDRIDNNCGYHEGNCHWETIQAQNWNRRPKKLNHESMKHIQQEYQYGNGKILAKKYGVSPAVISEIVNRKRNYAISAA